MENKLTKSQDKYVKTIFTIYSQCMMNGHANAPKIAEEMKITPSSVKYMIDRCLITKAENKVYKWIGGVPTIEDCIQVHATMSAYVKTMKEGLDTAKAEAEDSAYPTAEEIADALMVRLTSYFGQPEEAKQ